MFIDGKIGLTQKEIANAIRATAANSKTDAILKLGESVRFYPNLHAEYLRFVLITPDEVILPKLDRKLGLYAQRKLAARRIEMIPHARVTATVEGVVTLSNGQKIPSNMLIWAPGTAPNLLLNALSLPKRNVRAPERKSLTEAAG
jgi:NADH dehydrogenase FAD-containing subunit